MRDSFADGIILSRLDPIELRAIVEELYGLKRSFEHDHDRDKNQGKKNSERGNGTISG
jgi:hypothetical protein